MIIYNYLNQIKSLKIKINLNQQRSEFSFGSSLTCLDPFVWSVILEPLDDSVSASFSIEINWGLRFVLTPEFQSWESLNVNNWNFILSWIDLSNDDVWVVGQSFGSFVEVWGDGLAVSAPWGVELNQDFLVRVENHILEGLSDDDLDWGIVWFWDFGRFQELINLTSFDSFEEWGEVVSGDFFLVVDILVVFSSEEKNGWWVGSVDSQIFSKSVEKSITVVFVWEGEDDSFGVGGVKGCKGLLGRCWLVVTIGKEEKGGLFILEYFFYGVVVEGDDFSVDVEDEDKCQDNGFIHWLKSKIYNRINTRSELIAFSDDNYNSKSFK